MPVRATERPRPWHELESPAGARDRDQARLKRPQAGGPRPDRSCRRSPGKEFAISLALLMGLAGCSESTKRKWTYRSPNENYRNALDASEADIRRDAVSRIAESGYVTSDDAFSVLDAVARTDPVTQIRCIAVRAFHRYDDRRPVPTVLDILQATEESDVALPAGNDLKWEAARALVEFQRRGLLDAQEAATAGRLFIQLVGPRNPRQIRLVAAEGLGFYQDRDAFAPLIRTLREEDFALADTAERSLIALTGVTHEYDADAWEAWLASADDPFAMAGHTPQTTRPAGPTWWDRQKRAWQRAIRLRSD